MCIRFNTPLATITQVSGVTSASNGLTLTGNDVKLGGTLNGTTVVELAGNILGFLQGGSQSVLIIASDQLQSTVEGAQATATFSTSNSGHIGQSVTSFLTGKSANFSVDASTGFSFTDNVDGKGLAVDGIVKDNWADPDNSNRLPNVSFVPGIVAIEKSVVSADAGLIVYTVPNGGYRMYQVNYQLTVTALTGTPNFQLQLSYYFDGVLYNIDPANPSSPGVIVPTSVGQIFTNIQLVQVDYDTDITMSIAVDSSLGTVSFSVVSYLIQIPITF